MFWSMTDKSTLSLSLVVVRVPNRVAAYSSHTTFSCSLWKSPDVQMRLKLPVFSAVLCLVLCPGPALHPHPSLVLLCGRL